MAARRQLRHPELLAGLRVKGAEPFIVGGANEDEAAGRGEADAQVARAGLDALRAESGVLLINAEPGFPRNRAVVDVDGHELAVGSRIAGNLRAVRERVRKSGATAGAATTAAASAAAS